jgi:hypothetical protein
MDDEWDDIDGEPVDLDGGWCDVTGNPALDVDGYQSPRDRRNLTGFTAHPPNQDWLVKNRADRAARAAKRAADAAARREAKRNESSGERQSKQSPPTPPVQTTPAQVQPVQAPASDHDEILRRSLTELQPGQHGAYFERREVRCWYAPWKKRYVWQQTSAWMNTTPPTSGTEVVSVGSLDELNGRVHTIGTVGENGTVVY